MLIKDNGTHSFPDNTLEILSKSTAQQLKKKYTFQADPFLIEKDDKLYVFYEALSFRNSKGTLRCRVLDRELVELEDIRLEGFDDLKCHLSFPYLIHINDQLFMHNNAQTHLRFIAMTSSTNLLTLAVFQA